MAQFSLQLPDNRTAYSPRETLTGTASWQLTTAPSSAEVRLTWSTRGKGTPDTEIVATIPFPDPQASETRPFTLQLPATPYTFSGHLISLFWTVELSIDPDELQEEIEIVIAPDGREVHLPRIQPA